MKFVDDTKRSDIFIAFGLQIHALESQSMKKNTGAPAWLLILMQVIISGS